MMYSAENQKILLDIALKSIRHGLSHGNPLSVNLSDYPKELLEIRATFITLKIQDELRGCIGVLEASRPLVKDVVTNAYAAAFRDSRFPKLTKEEYLRLDISISILSPSESVEFTSEQDLINKIQPGVDGLILEDGVYRGTFLPSVWKSVDSPQEFLKHLKLKAGLPPHYWSDTIKIWRYTTEIIS